MNQVPKLYKVLFGTYTNYDPNFKGKFNKTKRSHRYIKAQEPELESVERLHRGLPK